MRLLLDTVAMDGVVVIGEGEKDEAPMLYNGEQIGDGSPPAGGHRRRPARGHELCANGLPNAIAMIALSERGTMFDPGPCVYMLKMATSRSMAHALDLDRPIGETLELMAKEKGVAVGDLVVIMLDRPRHEEYERDPRGGGAHPADPARRRVGGARGPVTEDSTVDLLFGIGGHAGGRAGRGRDPVHGRPDPGQALAALETRSGARRSRPATTSRRCSTRTGSCRRATSSSPPPG